MTFFSRKPSSPRPNPANATPPRTPQLSHPPEPKPAPLEPSQAAIRDRAHQLWLARGNAPGDELADWLRAESELKLELHAIQAAARRGGTT